MSFIPVKMKRLFAISWSSSSRSVMYRHLFLCLVLLLIRSGLTQDIRSDRPTTVTAANTVQSEDASPARTEFETVITEFKVTELETFLPTDIAQTMPPESLDDTVTPSSIMDTVAITQIGETIFTELENISSTELVTRMRCLCCPEGFLDVQGNCFRFEDDKTTFDGALDRCNFSSGGSLAKIEPIEPTTQYLLDITRYYSDSELIWIGLLRSRDNSNDTFTWTFDETTLNISNWADGQPTTNNTVNCATMSSDGTWVLRHCDETYPYICQSPPVFCAELTTAREVTTEEFTTAEITEIITNATTRTTAAATTMSTTTAATTTRVTTSATTNRPTTAPLTTTKISTLILTTKLTRKPTPEKTTGEEVTTEMMTEDETSPTKSTTPTSSPTSSSSATNRTLSSVPTTGGTIATNVTVAQPQGSTGRRNPTMSSQSQTTMSVQPTVTPSFLSTINKILIAIIVIFVVLAIIIGCMVIYLIYKRKKGKKAVYNVKDVEMELEDIKSVEDLSGPSTSSGSGVANTSFISDDMPGFSGAHFTGLKGKSFSLETTSHSEA